MKKHGILNSHIAKVLADLGHTDFIVIADAGLPIPDHVPKIDLALTVGVPGFKETLAAVADDLVIEKVTAAQEVQTQNEPIFDYMETMFSDTQIEWVTHEAFKALTKQAKAVIRTGEASPYANCILHAGVFF
ncbi:D-ribose pyranase [Pseudobacillus badius]|uniref:D-ribose pyranase n=1 Tax=Bacillus badius TaxID=1455 RepID=UPI001CBEAFBF|nr:D-ribose pyranase [Bacillus badius]MED0666885.1 D-ribose pyranase [Bacillus badius]UAT30631.1 D-ribose pyranase [Bacillus badius]GLY08921.1 D-ribose pyranase [Bacillus badius]